ncbi:MAG: hypothetical protein R2724_32320 [Bryobacterales bacterium]
MEKAKFDLKTAEVRSEIEAEVLKNLAQQVEAAFEQLEQQLTLEEEAHNAGARSSEDHRSGRQTAPRPSPARFRAHGDYFARQWPRRDGAATVRGGGQISQTGRRRSGHPGSLFMRVVDLSKMVLTAYVNQWTCRRCA